MAISCWVNRSSRTSLNIHRMTQNLPCLLQSQVKASSLYSLWEVWSWIKLGFGIWFGLFSFRSLCVVKPRSLASAVVWELCCRNSSTVLAEEIWRFKDCNKDRDMLELLLSWIWIENPASEELVHEDNDSDTDSQDFVVVSSLHIDPAYGLLFLKCRYDWNDNLKKLCSGIIQQLHPFFLSRPRQKILSQNCAA